MSFDWAEFLTVAEALSTADLTISREALLRSAVGRAYYAAFGTERHRARERRLQTRQSAAEHGEVSMFLSREYGETGAEIAKQLSRLRTNRNIADYEDECEDPERLAAESIMYARRVLTLLATL